MEHTNGRSKFLNRFIQSINGDFTPLVFQKDLDAMANFDDRQFDGSTLETTDVKMYFGGVKALDGASIKVEPGKLTSLIGPNGAGKTTLFNVITGFLKPTAGQVFLEGREITREPIRARSKMGIARTFQKLEAFNTLSTRDNILVAGEKHNTRTETPTKLEVDALMEDVGLAEYSDITVGTLPTGIARRVELARALATHPRILLLDEPSSGLNESETEEMAQLLSKLTKQGLSILLVEHDMSFVMSVSDFIYVLDFGKIIAQDIPEKIQNDPKVRAAYLGAH